GVRLEIEVATFCSRTHPSIVCQETQVRADGPCEIVWRAQIDHGGVRGELRARRTGTPGEAEPACDGTVLWAALGRISTCGSALLTEGPEGAERSQEPWDETGPLGTAYKLQLRRGRAATFRQMVAVLPSVMHSQPEAQALRLLAASQELGFDEIRRRNRLAW